jgi:hypothetical protein
LKGIPSGKIRRKQDEIRSALENGLNDTNRMLLIDALENKCRSSTLALEIDVQAENGTNLTDPTLNETGKADVETEAKREKYISVLLITIVLLLSSAFSRYP